MEFYYECIPCHIRAALNSIILLTDDTEIISKVIKKALIKASEFKKYKNFFELYYDIQNVVKSYIPNKDPFKDLKSQFNKICLSVADDLKRIIEQSDDCFNSGVRVCLAGNSIDVMQGKKMNRGALKESITNAIKQPLNERILKRFEREVRNANKILFIGDNAGEIVFDMIFIEMLNEKYKKEGKITYSVRGGYTLNDCTMEDAILVGINNVVKVITTGIDMPNAHLPLCSEEFVNAYREADLVISKGQGNLEALIDEEKNIFFLLKIKCQVMAKILDNRHKVDDIVIVHR
jgi:uncharacterized protein with ATP-grasp and redox domains